MYQLSKILILISTFMILHILCEGCQWSIEAEHGVTNGTTTYRGGTSNKLTVRLSEGQYIIWGFVTDFLCMLQILNVEYTNDGLSDNITVYADGKIVGSFTTKSQSNHGHLWNEPVSSGPLGNEITLSSGDHTVKLTATNMDTYGIEVDRMILGLICTNDVSNSDGICPKSQEPDIISSNDSWDKGSIITLVIGIISIVTAIVISIITCICNRRRNGANSHLPVSPSQVNLVEGTDKNHTVQNGNGYEALADHG